MVIAIVLEVWIQDTWHLSDKQAASFVAPLVEEPAKCLFLALTFVRSRRVIDGFLDGLIFAGIVGIGFAFIENIGYYVSSYTGTPDIQVAGAEGVTTTFVVRGLFSPFAHPLFTSAFGIAIGLAAARRSKTLKVLICFAGLLVSAGLHGLWNGSLSYGGGAGFVLAYLALAAVLVAIAVLAIIVRIRQVRILERSLSYVAQRGWIHPAEIPYLSRFGYRKAARRYAKDHGGKVAAQDRHAIPAPRDRDGVPARRPDERPDDPTRRRAYVCAARRDVRVAADVAIPAGAAKHLPSLLTPVQHEAWRRSAPTSTNLCSDTHAHRFIVDERSTQWPANTLRPSSLAR